MLALALSAAAAHAAVVVDAPREGTAPLPTLGDSEVTLLVPFHLERAGLFYAKLLVTPWNAVNDGHPNGTVALDHSRGIAGWWVRFALLDAAGDPLRADAQGREVASELGAYVDSTPTPLVALASGTPYHLLATVHVPSSASQAGGEHRVAFALAFRDPAASGSGSGASLDPSQGYTATIVVAGARASAPGGIGAQTGTGATGAPAPPAGPPVAGPSAAGTEDLGALLLGGILAVLVLLLAATAVAAQALLRIARQVEVRALLARPAAPAAPAAPPEVIDATPPATSAAPGVPPARAPAPAVVAAPLAPVAPAMPQPARVAQPARAAATSAPAPPASANGPVTFTRVGMPRPGAEVARRVPGPERPEP